MISMLILAQFTALAHGVGHPCGLHSMCYDRLDQPVQRIYWRVPLDSLAIGHNYHTHVAVTGRVVYVRHEADGDTHIKLAAPSGRFIIAECIPLLPCKLPAVGSTITVRGISRQDSEHGWYEVHPVEAIN